MLGWRRRCEVNFTQVIVERDTECSSLLFEWGALMTPKLITGAEESYREQGSVLTKKWSGRNRDFLGWSFHTQHLAFLKVQLWHMCESAGGAVPSLKRLSFIFPFC